MRSCRRRLLWLRIHSGTADCSRPAGRAGNSRGPIRARRGRSSGRIRIHRRLAGNAYLLRGTPDKFPFLVGVPALINSQGVLFDLACHAAYIAAKDGTIQRLGLRFQGIRRCRGVGLLPGLCAALSAVLCPALRAALCPALSRT